MNIGIIGCGFIGSTIAEAADSMPEIEVVKFTDIDTSRPMAMAQKHKKGISHTMNDMEGFLRDLDLVVECASPVAVKECGVQVLSSGIDLMVLSVAALTDDELWQDMRKAAKSNKANIFIPSGGVVGTDGLGSAVEAQMDHVTLTTTKHPKSFLGVKYVHDQGIDLMNLKEPVVIFEGQAKEAAVLFPKNLNVSTTVSVAGIGTERTKVKLIADPAITVNRHELKFQGRFGECTCVVSNSPSMTNPKTSYLAALSAIATLRKIVDCTWIG